MGVAERLYDLAVLGEVMIKRCKYNILRLVRGQSCSCEEMREVDFATGEDVLWKITGLAAPIRACDHGTAAARPWQTIDVVKVDCSECILNNNISNENHGRADAVGV